MINTDLLKRGGVEYAAPVCEIVELGINAAICDTASYGIQDWSEDETGLEF